MVRSRTRGQLAAKMRVAAVSMLAALLFTGIAANLFSRRDAEQTPTAAPEDEDEHGDEHHLVLARLLRKSENAITWLGNKTNSLYGLLKIKNQTSNVGNAKILATESPVAAKKERFLSWLRGAVKGKFHYNSGPSSESESSVSAEDSGEDLVIAHRTKDHGFSWGPPANSSADDLSGSSSGGLVRAAGHRLQTVLTVLYQRTKSLTARGKDFLKHGLTKVFAKKDPFLMRQYASESIEKQLENLEKNNATYGVEDIAFACDDNMKPVCAVDVDNHYTIFQNECKMVLFNFKHGTNFTIHNNDVCIGLFAQHPDLFYQSPDNSQKQKKP